MIFRLMFFSCLHFYDLINYIVIQLIYQIILLSYKFIVNFIANSFSIFYNLKNLFVTYMLILIFSFILPLSLFYLLISIYIVCFFSLYLSNLLVFSFEESVLLKLFYNLIFIFMIIVLSFFINLIYFFVIIPLSNFHTLLLFSIIHHFVVHIL